MSELQAATEIAERITLWQDFNHPQGYRPTLCILKFPDGRMALELSVFGRVTVTPYTKAECPECERGFP